MTETDREFVGYRLTLNVAGPNFKDTIELEDRDLLKLQPEFVDVNGLMYERYPMDEPEEYFEVRFDYVVSRELLVVYEDPKPSPPQTDYEDLPETRVMSRDQER